MIRSFAFLVLVAWFAGFLPGSTNASQSHTAYALADGFYRTVFGLEYAGHPDAYRVKRFDERVRFHVEDRSGFGRLPAARSFLASLPSRIRHFDGVEVTDPRAANFEVIIVRAQDFPAVVARRLKADALAMNARCLVGVTTVNGSIKAATAIIVGDDDRLFARCLVEEVLQGLGPMNDDPSLDHSVFNDTSRHTGFTAFDAGILNILYHPAIRPGMTARDVQRAMPKALASLGYIR